MGKPTGTPTAGMTALSPSFLPGDRDVICARGKAAKDHLGNLWFRSLIEEHIQEYSECESKLDKSFLVSKVMKLVRRKSPQGGFVKNFNGRWYEVGDRLSREKIGQTFRDMLHTQYRSSTKAKASMRRQRASTDTPSAASDAQRTVESGTATSSPAQGVDRMKAAGARPSSNNTGESETDPVQEVRKLNGIDNSQTNVMGAQILGLSAPAALGAECNQSLKPPSSTAVATAAAPTSSMGATFQNQDAYMSNVALGILESRFDAPMPMTQQYPPLPSTEPFLGRAEPIMMPPSGHQSLSSCHEINQAPIGMGDMNFLDQRVRQQQYIEGLKRQEQLLLQQQQELQQKQQILQQQHLQQNFWRSQQALSYPTHHSSQQAVGGPKLDMPMQVRRESGFSLGTLSFNETAFASEEEPSGPPLGPETIQEMYHAQLFDSENILGSTSSDSYPKQDTDETHTKR